MWVVALELRYRFTINQLIFADTFIIIHRVPIFVDFVGKDVQRSTNFL